MLSQCFYFLLHVFRKRMCCRCRSYLTISRNSLLKFVSPPLLSAARRLLQVAQMLNGQPIGGKKRSAYYYDLWAIKYLPKFKWDDLTADIAYERAVREQKLAAEVSQVRHLARW